MTALAFHPVSAPMTIGPTLSGHQVADLVGLSWERFRKVRTAWTRDRDFPAEINEPGEPVRYLAEPVLRWLDRRSRRVQAAAVPPRRLPAPGADPSAGRAGRQALSQILGGF
ncbi:hypothetical protein NI454_00895 [Brevundimonas diminuta]|uniref:hypothetical protein n=1 Tax=Brevundimonas diminuta TaxID=293 RepID=UPI002096A0CF|nr:hypothetical protein [Brevundimonas diminuta]MCO8028500.1 hypothetical protein [Brevundimonas diminuta]